MPYYQHDVEIYYLKSDATTLEKLLSADDWPRHRLQSLMHNVEIPLFDGNHPKY